MVTSQSRIVSVEKLHLDPENPRLPESLRGASQQELLKYLYLNGTLDELAASFIDNGFFAHEPLIVSGADNTGNHIVFEGNRRLATLKILLGLDAALAEDIAFSLDPMPTAVQLNQLQAVPCFPVNNPEDVHRFLGFRHIGGIKTWSAEAKARYLLTEVRRAYDLYPDKNPFVVVGRAVGSNAQGVRNPYIAIRILIQGREQFGIEVTTVQQYRFGVWNRAMNSPDLRNYIGFGSATTYHEVEEGLGGLLENRLREVLNDMTPQPNQRAVLADSRDVTIYAAVLQNEHAHEVLRQYDDLDLARQIVEKAEIPQRIKQLGFSIENLNREIQRQGAPQEALGPARELVQLAQALFVLVEGTTRIDE